ncbi:Hypothetical protein ETEE_p1056 (plasmid) [Edwardsiella anguillarum ET080813]|uniref:Uncharacterized protein n=1 Tax=Edwardsiella anguillarum ET080813 TaxID=667120 RepID=A0A076LVG0_9GAMM|nr:Hypothetical protein ETEE_p1056 [Edwardsiella anguillarum ET080813]
MFNAVPIFIEPYFNTIVSYNNIVNGFRLSIVMVKKDQ